MSKIKILETTQVYQKLDRLAYEILEHTFNENEVFIAGIDGNGYIMAKLLAKRFKKISGKNITTGKISINKKTPWSESSKTDFSIKDFKNKTVVLVDDVLNSGKTLMYAVKVFLDHPIKKLHTVVLVDRSHTQYPVKADFVGLTLSTTLQEHIEVDFSTKNKEAVYLI